jgi:hypothetical protein
MKHREEKKEGAQQNEHENIKQEKGWQERKKKDTYYNH